jgi:hypothetical protein
MNVTHDTSLESSALTATAKRQLVDAAARVGNPDREHFASSLCIRSLGPWGSRWLDRRNPWRVSSRRVASNSALAEAVFREARSSGIGSMLRTGRVKSLTLCACLEVNPSTENQELLHDSPTLFLYSDLDSLRLRPVAELSHSGHTAHSRRQTESGRSFSQIPPMASPI